MSEERRVLITGAGGFIGRNLSRHLATRGHSLVLNTRRQDRFLPRASNIQLALGSVSKVVPERTDLAELDAVVHLAASANSRIGDANDERIKLEGLERVLQALKPEGPCLIFLSSGGTVYQEGTLPHKENSSLAPRSPYAQGSVACEEAIQSHATQRGLRTLILRCSNPYGPFQSIHKSQGLILTLLKNLEANQPTRIWGDGTAVRDYFYVEDLCRLFDTLLRRDDAQGVYNIGSGVGVSILQVLDRIEDAIGRRPEIEFDSATPGTVQRNVLDITRARETFGWEAATSLPDGISATWEWLREFSALEKGSE